MVPERGDEPGSDGDGGANGDAQVTDPVTPGWGHNQWDNPGPPLQGRADLWLRHLILLTA